MKAAAYQNKQQRMWRAKTTYGVNVAKMMKKKKAEEGENQAAVTVLSKRNSEIARRISAYEKKKWRNGMKKKGMKVMKSENEKRNP